MGAQFSTRVDVLSPELIAELEKLQDRVPPFSSAKAVAIIEEQLGGPLDEVCVKFVVHELCLALEYLHGENKIHRDIKAANVLLTATGDVRLADFGVSGLPIVVIDDLSDSFGAFVLPIVITDGLGDIGASMVRRDEP